ncbi:MULTISPECIES: TIGR03986 family type III CRISPR-associated RAMP protein [Cohnella]|uniref:TIGR03986 family type III CRISPR-associated RAMP protein n=1 Tax=Cohnella TaxID=329857 RepID=UPI0009BC6581|nr:MULTISPECIES: TIGR03986 family CRISPR-associated RAMP protein [Cohnella]MBN2982168.1 TIGR03986 family CRISPR-associated RAMP protein [Cohnella algarum]
MSRFSKKEIANFAQNDSQWKIDLNESFVNPYTFIPLGDECTRMNPEHGTLSGYIECELTPHTPLIIPNTSGPKSETNPFYNFYGYRNLEAGQDKEEYYPPVVPGSEIRGAIRSVHEAATNSCMSVVNTDPEDYLFRRSGIPRNKFGILKFIDGDWVLFKAEKKKVRSHKNLWNRYSQGSRVVLNKEQVEVIGLFDNLGTNQPEYYLHISKYMPKKKNESVFKLTNQIIRRFSDDDLSIRKLHELLKNYEDNEKNASEPSYRIYLERLKAKDGQAICVYYYDPNDYNGTYLFAPSSISKDMFLNQPYHILKDNGGYQPCEDPDCLCPSCSLFGMVGKKGSMGSRLRFTDATIVNPLLKPQEYYRPELELTLASPKPSAAEFYLERPNMKHDKRPADHWNYDYAVRYDRKLKNKEVIQYGTAILRGRKFYWHGVPIKNDNKQGKNSKLTHTVRPVKPGITFAFKVYFHHLTEQELANLKWVLELRSSDNGNHMHKLGYAKPLGMGSVKIAVKQIKTRDSRELQRRGSFVYRAYEPGNHSIEPKVLERLLKVTDFNFPDKPLVSYPKVHGRRNEEIYQWFAANQSLRIQNGKIKHSSFPPVILEQLPHIDSADQKLHKYIQINPK